MRIAAEDIEERPTDLAAAISSFTGLDQNTTDGLKKHQYPKVAEHLSLYEAERLVRQFRLAPELFDVNARDYRQWHTELTRKVPGALDNEPGLIVAFHSADARYAREAHRMRSSIEALGLPLFIEVVPHDGDWLSAVRLKPRFLHECRTRFRGPLLYIDVDAVVHANPWPYLRGYVGDLAVAGHRDEAIISGTMLLNDTPQILPFIDAWIDAQEQKPSAWDQHSLQEVVLANRKAAIDYLPPELCRVFDRRYNPPVDPIIEHLQASRERFSFSTDYSLLKNLQRRKERTEHLDKVYEGPLFSDLPLADRRERTLDLMQGAASDRMRWSKSENLKPAWSARAELAARFIEDNARVLDIGCGAMMLERYLPQNATYIPADLIARDPRTILCDLNRLVLPDADADVAVMLGVLEYCHDLSALFSHMKHRWPWLVLSYNPVDLEDGRRDRRAHGWFNDLSSACLVKMLDEAGYDLACLAPCAATERLYHLEAR